MAEHGILDYHQITDNIFLGTNACCKHHFEEELLEKGVTYDISLEEERIDAPWGVEAFLWLPTTDHTAPSMRSLVLGVQVLIMVSRWNAKVYVHCKNGHGRAPTLVAAYFISQGDSVNEAIAKVAEKRPEIHIEDAQKKMLEKFAKEVKW